MKNFIYLFLGLLLIGCSTDDTLREIEETDMQLGITSAELNEASSPVEVINYRGLKVQAQKKDTFYLAEGDIMIPLETQKAAAISEDYWWEDGTIPYTIDPMMSDPQRIYDAIAHFEEHTNIDFYERTDETNYVYFVEGSGCRSYIGEVGGRQPVVLSPACSTGNTIHELGHVAGLWHEHTRADRDEYIDVMFDNIIDGYEHNFVKYTEFSVGGVDLTPELDFESIMMYHPFAFTENGMPTITKNDGTLYRVQRSYLSEGDIAGLNQMYPAEPEYENGKYYVINGVTVYRLYDRWYYYHSKYGWKEVRLSSSGYWYFA